MQEVSQRTLRHLASQHSLVHLNLCSSEILGQSPHSTSPSCVSSFAQPKIWTGKAVDGLSKASYRRLMRSLRNVIATRNHERNETHVEVYSHCCGHFTRQISRVLRFILFRIRSGKIIKSKGFLSKKIFYKKIV